MAFFPPRRKPSLPRRAYAEHRRLRRRTRLRTLITMLPWVIGSVAVSLTVLLAVRDAFPPGSLPADANDVVLNALQTLGSIYAVLLAFVVFVVWGQFNEARASVDREANAIADLHRVLGGLPPRDAESSRRALLAYLDSVLDGEWDALAGADECALGTTSDTLEGVWAAIHGSHPKIDAERAMHAEAVLRFNDLSDARSIRLTDSSLRIPFALRTLLYLGALTVVGSLYFLDVKSLGIHAWVTGTLAAALAHVLYVIEDLDSLFAGDWQVSDKALVRLRGHLTAR